MYDEKHSNRELFVAGGVRAGGVVGAGVGVVRFQLFEVPIVVEVIVSVMVSCGQR
jgi:hypothetical protein